MRTVLIHKLDIQNASGLVYCFITSYSKHNFGVILNGKVFIFNCFYNVTCHDIVNSSFINKATTSSTLNMKQADMDFYDNI